MENVVKDALLVLTSKNEKVLKKNKERKIYKPYECKSYNVVYAFICMNETCKKAYLGEIKKC